MSTTFILLECNDDASLNEAAQFNQMKYEKTLKEYS